MVDGAAGGTGRATRQVKVGGSGKIGPYCCVERGRRAEKPELCWWLVAL